MLSDEQYLLIEGAGSWVAVHADDDEVQIQVGGNCIWLSPESTKRVARALRQALKDIKDGTVFT